MTGKTNFDVIVIGGSYSGLSATMALARSLRSVLVIDSGNPCNKQTPQAHNLLSGDGDKPGEIAEKAKAKVLKYKTVEFYNGLATSGKKLENSFLIETEKGDIFTAKKMLFATGVVDIMPSIKGFAECWGISVLHCPYCHGYEVKHQNIGLLANGDAGFDLAKLISNWSGNITLFTNGQSTLTTDQEALITKHSIKIVEKEIGSFEHSQGEIKSIVFQDNSSTAISAVFARIGFRQHCDMPLQMGCELTKDGHIQVNEFCQTSVGGIFAAGDSTTFFRALSVAIAAGTMAGVMINKEFIEEDFK